MSRDTSQSDRRLTRRQRTILSLVAVVCIVLTSAALVAAQQTGYQEGWEDGTLDGYNVTEDPGTLSEVNSDNPSEGSNALYQQLEIASTSENQRTEAVLRGDTEINFSDGTILEYDIDADIDTPYGGSEVANTVYTSINIEGGDGDNIRMMYGSFLEPSSAGGFRLRGSAVGPTAGDQSGRSVDTNGYSTVELVYDEPNQEIDLYVDGNFETTADYLGFSDPSNASLEYRTQITELNDGSGSAYVYYDNITSTGVESTSDSEDLNIDAPNYMRPNTTAHYTVEANQSGTWVDVTEDADITVEDPNAATFYPSNGTVVATNDTSYANSTNVTATYDGLQDSEKMTVAAPTVENLDILPTWWKVNATVGDGMMLWLIVATLAAVVATRAATSFAGVGAYVMFMVAGWMTGSVSDGVMVATILTGMFLGMNLAANVDTTIRGSG